MRLDAYLVQCGLFDSRARAQAAIKAGRVRVNGAVAAKPAQNVAEGAAVDLAGDVHPWASRGGVKLDVALGAFGVDPAGRACLDLGASTGGFTDVLLARGAAKVYAVDVGTGQLRDRLRNDSRVVALERTHAKDLSRALVPDAVDLLVADVSFISLKKALPAALALAADTAQLVALVKPQFEAGRARIGKGGVVRGETRDIAEDLLAWIGGEPGWRGTRWIESPILGGDGNREYLMHAVKRAGC